MIIIPVFIFIIGILGFTLNRRNILLLIVSIELMLLASTIIILINSINFNDSEAQTFGVYIIAIAGAESAIALGILVAYYRLRGTISINILYINVSYNSLPSNYLCFYRFYRSNNRNIRNTIYYNF